MMMNSMRQWTHMMIILTRTWSMRQNKKICMFYTCLTFYISVYYENNYKTSYQHFYLLTINKTILDYTYTCEDLNTWPSSLEPLASRTTWLNLWDEKKGKNKEVRSKDNYFHGKNWKKMFNKALKIKPCFVQALLAH